MVKTHRPLFNRTYLKILPWVVAVVIVLLTAKQAQDRVELPQELPYKINGSPLYQFQHPEFTEDTLRLVLDFPQPPQETQRIQLSAFKKALLTVIKDRPNLKTLWFTDRLQLDIPLARLNDQTLNTILDELDRDTRQKQPEFEAETAAEYYLDQQNIEQRAINQAQALLAQSKMNTNNRTLSKRIRAALLLCSEESLKNLPQENISKQLAISEPAKVTEADEQPNADQPKQESKLTHRGSDYLLLSATAVSNKNELEYQVLLPLLGELLKQLKQKGDQTGHPFSYRLLLEPSYAALIIRKATAFNTKPTEKIKTLFSARLSDEDINAIKKQILADYRKRFAALDSQTQLFADQLFYQQAIETLDQLADRLDKIDPASVKLSLNKLLNSEHSVQIFIQPQG